MSGYFYIWKALTDKALSLNKDHVIMIEGPLSEKYNNYKHIFIQHKNISREHQHMKGRIVWKTVTIGKVHCNIFSYRWIYSVRHQQKHIKPEQASGLRTAYVQLWSLLPAKEYFSHTGLNRQGKTEILIKTF